MSTSHNLMKSRAQRAVNKSTLSPISPTSAHAFHDISTENIDIKQQENTGGAITQTGRTLAK